MNQPWIYMYSFLGLSRSNWVKTLFFFLLKKIYSYIQRLSLSKLNKEREEILKESERNKYFQNLEFDETKKQWILHSSSTVFTGFLVSPNWIKVDCLEEKNSKKYLVFPSTRKEEHFPDGHCSREYDASVGNVKKSLFYLGKWYLLGMARLSRWIWQQII